MDQKDSREWIRFEDAETYAHPTAKTPSTASAVDHLITQSAAFITYHH